MGSAIVASFSLGVGDLPPLLSWSRRRKHPGKMVDVLSVPIVIMLLSVLSGSDHYIVWDNW